MLVAGAVTFVVSVSVAVSLEIAPRERRLIGADGRRPRATPTSPLRAPRLPADPGRGHPRPRRRIAGGRRPLEVAPPAEVAAARPSAAPVTPPVEGLPPRPRGAARPAAPVDCAAAPGPPLPEQARCAASRRRSPRSARASCRRIKDGCPASAVTTKCQSGETLPPGAAPFRLTAAASCHRLP